MKKLITLVLVLVCVLGLVGCSSKTKYKVELADNYRIANDLKSAYSAGEEVTIKLETITEHYYIVSANGVEIEMNRDASDMTFTYYTFTMPNENIIIEIEDRWVDIPEAPKEDTVSENNTVDSNDTTYLMEKEKILNIALEHCKTNYDFIDTTYDSVNEEWKIEFWETGAKLPAQRVFLDNNGNVINIWFAE